MKKELKGIIEFDNDECRRIILHNNSKEIDLIDELEYFDNQQIQVNYWIADNPCSKEQMLEGYLKQLFGCAEVEYDNYFNGSWTYGCQSSWGDYEKRGVLKIGGHDLFDELSEMNGKFIIIEINSK